MDLQVPLYRLKFGHEDGGGINARVTGREDGLAALAANIHANGQIENLIVKDAGGGFYAVANGNRRLAAFHMIYGAESNQPINCTLHDVDETKGFEFSLTTAVTAEQLHPVDQYEGFARLKERGQTDEEIARKYGLSEHEVAQALALGALSPSIREAWRRGEIKASVAKAFTLADNHAAQDEVMARFRENDRLRHLDDEDVKRALKIGVGEVGSLVEFVGFDAYVAAGGKVTRDLFGTDHKISDAKLAKKLADNKLAEECARLKKEGWSFALTGVSNKWEYSSLGDASEPSAEERERLASLEAMFDPAGDVRFGQDLVFNELTAGQQKAFLAHRALKDEIARRGFTPAMMEKSGCFVGIDDNGMLKIEYGRVKPAEKKAAAKVAKDERAAKKKADAKTAKAEGKPAPEPKELSNALKDRLASQLVAATRDAIAGDPLLRESPFADVLARTICAQIDPDRPYSMPDAVRTKLPSIRQVCDAAVFNAAVAKRFDAENYFSSAPKGFVLKAIGEAINPDEARKIAAKSKAEIWKFALANIPKTGWLPKELRTVHYKGPGSEGYKRPAAAPQAAAAPSTREAIKKAKQERTEKAAARAAKVHVRKASAKKTAQKKR